MDYTILAYYSPIEIDIIVKYSDIMDGKASIFYFSKNDISYFRRVLRYCVLKLKEIFSARCCQKPTYT
jgi:hypothetical protein